MRTPFLKPRPKIEKATEVENKPPAATPLPSVWLPDADEFQLHIYAALAQQERKFISERVAASLAAAKARGVKLGGRRPNAEARHKAVRQKTNDNARRVYDVIKSFRDTGTPYSKIATHLNNLKVPTATGGKWYDSTVRRYNLRMNA